MYRFLSFGAGVQSTALWLLLGQRKQEMEAKLGPLPTAAYFADTGAEPDEIYRHLQRLQEIAERKSMYIPIHVCKKDGLSLAETMLRKDGSRFLPIPAFTGFPGQREGMLRRQCTREYKIAPLHGAYRRAMGLRPKQRAQRASCESWIGISTDEAGRATASDEHWLVKRYPLLELGLSRSDCARIIRKAGLKPVKSRCYFCPYISDWNSFREAHPDAFKKAIEVDEAIRDSTGAGANQPCWLHRNLIPLKELEKVDQLSLFAEPWEDWGFEDECSGMCGI